ncbi:MAG: TrmJ/YjtD family RNA methyltransferase [Gemmatimonadetes bacterium]|nr:MAG: TrmJ/YjtD family RNA methyltransferase [Gemmatimonadota bacterium]
MTPDDQPRSAGNAVPALDRVIVVLYEPQNLVNVAGVVRAMKNMGLSRLRVVRPAEWDPWRITGIAHRSEDLVESAEHFDDIGAALADCHWIAGTTARARTAARNYLRPREAAPGLIARAREGDVAIVFGREDRGLDNDVLDRCHAVLVVPTAPDYSSLNLAQACLLICYEMFLVAEADHLPELPRGKRAQGPATRADLEEMYQAVQEGLARLRFFKGTRRPESVMRALRTALDRASLDRSEARLIRAIGFEMRHVLDRLERQRDA